MKQAFVFVYRLLLGFIFITATVLADVDRVIRIIDGDTVVLEKLGRARLIGVDAAEPGDRRETVEQMAREAAEFARRQLQGKSVRVEYDWEKKDKYGRALVYLYLEDGTFFNAELIKQGYAHAYTDFPFKYLEEFRRYAREARENNRGLWSSSFAVNNHRRRRKPKRFTSPALERNTTVTRAAPSPEARSQ